MTTNSPQVSAPVPGGPKPKYHPEIFDPSDMTEARKISLPDYPEGLGGDERWEKETPWLLERIEKELSLPAGKWILDYGCGVGRLAKKFCEKGYFVLGVEQSSSMRRFAVEYVNDPAHFLCVSNEMLKELVNAGLRVDGAYSVWCVYLCPETAEVYTSIRSTMKFNAKFVNVNVKDKRYIPALAPDFRWIEDSINIWRIADSFFGLCNTVIFPPELDPKNKFLVRTYMRTIVPNAKD